MWVFLHTHCCCKPPLLPPQPKASPVRLIPSPHDWRVERRPAFPCPAYRSAGHPHWVAGWGRGAMQGKTPLPTLPVFLGSEVEGKGPGWLPGKLKLGLWDS